ncbi:MLO-like protein 6 [Rhododendron vialii]|uniref:MLO-like protein 6 n=1 Tax=Rhododendron vialii TaxID=182163 RepID=UPI00265F2D7E|nr:MLO-like protein 6 [Rhododendron vialii]
MAGGSEERSLEDTPTWTVAVVCFVLVLVSIVIEHLIHLIGSWLRKRHKRSLYEALEKIKEELMLLGFISLLLTVTQDRIAGICIPKSVGNSWHPCDRYHSKEYYGDKCSAKDKVQFVSAYGIHQLHIFIFVLALFHVLYCIITLGLGTLKMRKWKTWEDETKTLEYQYQNDPERFRFARETSFGRRHLDFWSHSPILLWIVCFFRQFFTSVTKIDYLTLRHGFVTAHLAPQSEMDFDFQKYISRSLEEDFKVVVGISPIIWLFAVLFLLTNTHGWYSYFWLPFIPLIILLVVGAKLQVIITKMGLRIQERGDVVKGAPVVQPGDDLFWFNRPRLILFLIHIVLFTNAFQIAFFMWSWYTFGFRSCFHNRLEDIIIRLSMGLIIQVLCSYVTLPLYALMTQMGSTMKPAIFKEQVPSSKNSRQPKTATWTPFSSRPGTPLHGMSPVHLLNGYKDSSAVDNSRQRSLRKSDADMIEEWDPEIAIRNHDDGEESRMSRWNDQVRDQIGEIGSTQRPNSVLHAPVGGGPREVRISLGNFSFGQNRDRK